MIHSNLRSMLLPALSLLIPAAAATANEQLYLDGKHLPKDFVYGCGLSAYQIEGAWNEDGKGVSIWDTFTADKGKGHVLYDDDGRTAIDFYHTYKKDIPLFRQALGINMYDFTIAWTRILPNGTGKVNQKGLDFYRDVIKTTHDAGMTASCTIYHWDLPQALQDKYGGWLSNKVVADFKNYAGVLYDNLGDLCDKWVSMNEPRTFCTEGYGPDTDSAPGHNGTFEENYKCMHNALLAHSAASELFREKKKAGKVRGEFGIKIDGGPAVPLDPRNASHVAVVQRANDFEMGWDAGPIWSGDYPEVMKKTLGKYLPTFTKEQSKKLKGSADFLAFDAYTSQLVWPIDSATCEEGDDTWPICVNESDSDDLSTDPLPPILGRPTQSPWNFQANSTIYDGVKYLSERWGVKSITIGENGMAERNSSQLPLAQKLRDIDRIEWYHSSLLNVQRAIADGLPLHGWIPWACISNFEWSSGYRTDFGLIYTEPGKDKKRYPKLSAKYMKNVFTKGGHIEPYASFNL